MKKVLFFIASTALIAIMTGCELPASAGSEATSFNITIDGIPTASSRSINTEVAVDRVYVKVFDSNRNLLVPAANASIEETGATQFTKNGNGIWAGTITLDGTESGTLTFLAYGTNFTTKKHWYSGSGTLTVESGNTHISIGTHTGYALGDFGPGGGYIASVDNVNHNYLEAAPYGWSGGLATLEADPQAIWGKRGITVTGTSTAIGTGKANTTQINSIIGSSYSRIATATLAAAGAGYAVNDILTIGSGTGGKVRVTATNPGVNSKVTSISTQLDGTNAFNTELGSGYSATTGAATTGGTGTGCTITTTVVTISNPAGSRSNITLNGYSDWGLPSSASLTAMYSVKTAGQFVSNGTYWSSSELDAYNAAAYTFGSSSGTALTGTGATSNTNNKDLTTFYVRPARYF